jgi:hypothetical protein
MAACIQDGLHGAGRVICVWSAVLSCFACVSALEAAWQQTDYYSRPAGMYGVRFLRAGCCLCRCAAAAACRPLQSYAARQVPCLWPSLFEVGCGSLPCTCRLYGSVRCLAVWWLSASAAFICAVLQWCRLRHIHPTVLHVVHCLDAEQTLFISGFVSMSSRTSPWSSVGACWLPCVAVSSSLLALVEWCS